MLNMNVIPYTAHADWVATKQWYSQFHSTELQVCCNNIIQNHISITLYVCIYTR